ncbi:MAG TPA: CAP domain-containing protein, partial [Acidimicrobiales bacterium]|nr:CAP domain-containing protein [Acidimicrobiales bacterium]
MWRRTVISGVGALCVVVLAAGVAQAAVSAPDTSSEAAFTQRIGAERSGQGLGPVRVAADLVDVARRHAEDMGNQHRLFDDQNVGNEVQNWQAVGENSGTGPSVASVDQAFMDSPPHRAIILDPRFTEVGVGVVWTGNTMWVAEVFRQPLNSSSPASPPP